MSRPSILPSQNLVFERDFVSSQLPVTSCWFGLVRVVFVWAKINPGTNLPWLDLLPSKYIYVKLTSLGILCRKKSTKLLVLLLPLWYAMLWQPFFCVAMCCLTVCNPEIPPTAPSKAGFFATIVAATTYRKRSAG